MNMLQEKLNFLLNKYDISSDVQIIDCQNAVIDGKAVQLLPWRSERRFSELKKLVESGTLNGLSTMRITHIAHKGADLFELFFREADICETIMGSALTEIFAVSNGDTALNVLAKNQDGCVCTFELAATLSDGAEPIDKHEIIACTGIACDRVVDTQVPQSSVYVLGEKNTEQYTDVDMELFGLDIGQCAAVRNCFEMAKTGEDTEKIVFHLNQVVEAAKKSISEIENVILSKAI